MNYFAMRNASIIVAIIVTSITNITAQIIETTGELTIQGSIAVPEDAELKTHLDIVNISGQLLTLKVYRVLEDVVAGSRNRFCWGGVCYDYNTNTSLAPPTMLDPGEMIPADDLYAFTGYYEHANNAGCSQINYCFFDANNTELETCIEVRYNVDGDCAVGLSEREAQITLSGANPVSSLFALNYDLGRRSGKNNSVVIRTFTGTLAKEIKLTSAQGALFLDAAEFSSGVYFYSILSDGEIVMTKKLVVSR
jgi:hypothetical protein